MRDSFVFYKSFYEAIETLPKAKKIHLYDAIVRFALFSEEPSLEGALQGMFNLIKPQLSANLARYENGKKGGRPKNEKEPKQNLEKNKNKPKQNQTITTKEPNVNENENENVNVNENVNGLGFSFPSLTDVLVYSTELGINNDEYCEKFYNHYESIGWVNGTGQKIKNWKLVFNNWAKKDNLKNDNDFVVDTEMIYEDEFGKYRLNADGKRVVC